MIELLVVIAIISVLMTILVPSLKTARDLAKRALCMTQQQNLSRVFCLYWEDYDFRNPFFRETDIVSTYWPWAMRSYASLSAPPGPLTDAERNNLAFEAQPFNCPSAFKTAIWSQPDHADNLVPFGTTYTPGVCSIGINYFLSYNGPDADGTGNFRYPRMDMLKTPALAALLMDTGRAFIAYGPYGSHWGGNCCWDPRHLGSVNMVMADGHIESQPHEWFYPWNDNAYRSLRWPDLLK